MIFLRLYFALSYSSDSDSNETLKFPIPKLFLLTFFLFDREYRYSMLVFKSFPYDFNKRKTLTSIEIDEC